MSKYRFIVHNGGWRDAPAEAELPIDDAARTIALQMIRDLKSCESIPITTTPDDKAWESWSLEVRESGRHVYQVPYTASE